MPAVTALDRRAVVLADGSRVFPDAIVAATGYHPGLEPLVGDVTAIGSTASRGRSRAFTSLESASRYRDTSTRSARTLGKPPLAWLRLSVGAAGWARIHGRDPHGQQAEQHPWAVRAPAVDQQNCLPR